MRRRFLLGAAKRRAFFRLRAAAALGLLPRHLRAVKKARRSRPGHEVSTIANQSCLYSSLMESSAVSDSGQIWPPSIMRLCEVMKPASSEARKSAALAMS